MEKILLFIPAYNCENQIQRVLAQLDDEILQYINKVLIINNCSTDKTEEKALEYITNNKKKLNGKVCIFRNNENYGLGGSHKVAFNYAIKNNFDYVIVLHGDDQGNIKDFLPILKNKEYVKSSCILGARFMKDSKLLGYSKFRTFGNRVYNIIFSVATGKKIYDLGSGLNMYSEKMLEDKYYMKFPDNLMFNYCMILASNYYKQDIKFLPISWREEDQKSNVKMVSQAFIVLGMVFKYLINKQKFIKKEFRTKVISNYGAKEIKGE